MHPFHYRTVKGNLPFHQVIKFKSEFGTAGKKCIHDVKGVARIFPDVRTFSKSPFPLD